MSKVGVIVEGEGEIKAIENIIKKLKLKNEIIRQPLRADLQPKATPEVIAKSAESRVKLCKNRGVKKIVVLIDKEDHPCAVRLAASIEGAFKKIYAGMELDFSVVVKNSMIENWLIADPSAFKKMPAKFKVTAAFENAVSNDKADNIVNPVEIINKIIIKNEYSKGSDPSSIMEKQDPLIAAENSRSYRKFLREIGCVVFAGQSKKPNKKMMSSRVAKNS